MSALRKSALRLTSDCTAELLASIYHPAGFNGSGPWNGTFRAQMTGRLWPLIEIAELAGRLVGQAECIDRRAQRAAARTPVDWALCLPGPLHAA